MTASVGPGSGPWSIGGFKITVLQHVRADVGENPVRCVHVCAAHDVRGDLLHVNRGMQFNVVNVHVPRLRREQVSLRSDARDALQFIRRGPIREPVQDRGGQRGVAAQRRDTHAIEFTRRRGVCVSPFVRIVRDGDYDRTVGGVVRDRRVSGDVGGKEEIGVRRKRGSAADA